MAECRLSDSLIPVVNYLEKEAVEEQLEAERRCFSGKLTALRRRQAALLRDKQNIL